MKLDAKQIVGTLVVLGAIAGICAFVFTNDPVGDCTKRGEKYFKEIGSWPRLSNGSDAATVARDRCERRPETAFPK